KGGGWFAAVRQRTRRGLNAETRMRPAPRQSVRPSSSTSTQTATSRRVPRDHSGTLRAISTPMPLRGMCCRLPSGLLLTVLSRPSKWIGSCLCTPISSAASALWHSMIFVLDEIRVHGFFSISPFWLPPLSVRYDRPVIDSRAPPPDPAAGRKQRRRMSFVTLPQASAGAALFGRAVPGRLDDASHLAPLRGKPSPCGFASLCRQGDNGEFVQWGWCVARTAMGCPASFDFSVGYGRSLI